VVGGGDSGGEVGVEEEQQRDEDPPGEDAAGDGDGGEFRPDDVTNAMRAGDSAGVDQATPPVCSTEPMGVFE